MLTLQKYMARKSKTFMFLVLLQGTLLIGCTEAGTQHFTGMIEWTAQAKDVPSLCYSYTFTRSDNGQKFGLRFQNMPEHTPGYFSGKTFEVTGHFVTEERKFNAMEQRPIDINGDPEPVTCHYFTVSNFYPAK